MVIFLCSIYEEIKGWYPCGAKETRAARSHSMRGAAPRAILWLIQENREADLGERGCMWVTPATQGVLSFGSCYSLSEHCSSLTELPRVYSWLAHKVDIPRECIADKRADIEAKAFSHKARFEREQTSAQETNAIHIWNRFTLGIHNCVIWK